MSSLIYKPRIMFVQIDQSQTSTQIYFQPIKSFMSTLKCDVCTTQPNNKGSIIQYSYPACSIHLMHSSDTLCRKCQSCDCWIKRDREVPYLPCTKNKSHASCGHCLMKIPRRLSKLCKCTK